MTTDDPQPVLPTARSVVLLIFFMPSTPGNPQQVVLTSLADSIQVQLGDLVRVLRIDEATQPDVVQTFGITQMPAFVLLRRGVELWRQQGLSDAVTLVELIRGLLTAGPRSTDPVKNQPPT